MRPWCTPRYHTGSLHPVIISVLLSVSTMQEFGRLFIYSPQLQGTRKPRNRVGWDLAEKRKQPSFLERRVVMSITEGPSGYEQKTPGWRGTLPRRGGSVGCGPQEHCTPYPGFSTAPLFHLTLWLLHVAHGKTSQEESATGFSSPSELPPVPSLESRQSPDQPPGAFPAHPPVSALTSLSSSTPTSTHNSPLPAPHPCG